jgi:hypothetical protein
MLDANDIQIITKLLEQSRNETHAELEKFRSEMRAELEKNRIATRNDMRAIIESEVNPKLQLLAEGHEVLLEKINRLEKQNELTGRVVILEEAVKKLNKEVNALKQAQ